MSKVDCDDYVSKSDYEDALKTIRELTDNGVQVYIDSYEELEEECKQLWDSLKQHRKENKLMRETLEKIKVCGNEFVSNELAEETLNKLEE